MRQRIVKRISNGETIDLSKLSKRKLKSLHFEEEKYIAEKILYMRPFSKERTDLMQQGYSLVNTIMPWYLPNTKISFGADEKSVGLVCRLLKTDKKNLIYEAGVGTGFSCERFVKLPNTIVHGCDILINDKIKQLMKEYDNINIEESTLYDSLKNEENNSIDCFYADNVFEHLLPDEFSQILHLLYCKIKKGGLIILIIPNRLIGPGDVSKYFKKRGEVAEGFHFMEMSYRDVLAKFKRIGIIPKYFIWRDKEGGIKYVNDKWGMLNGIKVAIECVASLCVKKIGLGTYIFHKMAMTYYILTKK